MQEAKTEEATLANVESQEARRLRRTKVGVVVSNKMDKTAIIVVERMVRHPFFQQY